MFSPRIGLLALLISTAAMAGECLAQSKSSTGATTPQAPGSKLSPDKQALLKQMPVGGRYRSAIRRNLQIQQAREDIAKAAAEQKAEADRKEALRKAELRRAAADASRSLKEREQDRAERVRKLGDNSPASQSAAKKRTESKTSETASPQSPSKTVSAEKSFSPSAKTSKE